MKLSNRKLANPFIYQGYEVLSISATERQKQRP